MAERSDSMKSKPYGDKADTGLGAAGEDKSFQQRQEQHGGEGAKTWDDKEGLQQGDKPGGSGGAHSDSAVIDREAAQR